MWGNKTMRRTKKRKILIIPYTPIGVITGKIKIRNNKKERRNEKKESYPWSLWKKMCEQRRMQG